MDKKPSIPGFIASLLILGGIVWFLVWVNTREPEYDVEALMEREKECKGGPATVSHGDTASWAISLDQQKEGDVLTFDGYIKLPKATFLSNGTYLINLTPDSTRSGGITLVIWEGDCENTMKPIPNEYENSDLLIYDNNSKKIRYGDKVRVTGKVTDVGAAMMLSVKRIEKYED